MDITLTGKRAIVCGSTQGIGKAVAVELASLGAAVALVARNEEALQRVKSELSTAAGQQHATIAVDFMVPEAVQERVGRYVNQAAPIHILINNTGGPKGGSVVDAELQEFVNTFSQHLLCNHILAQAVIPGMKAARYGRIVNIISTSVKQPIPELGVSNTIRGAVASWAKTLAGEVAQFGITVNNILPGMTKTGRLDYVIRSKADRTGKTVEEITKEMIAEIPAGRYAEPQELAAAVAFLCSPAASY
ncbi:MAG: SDR family NAD(P)-dependent oxidoreductase, partial [Bacteroidota bacterium]